MCCCFGARSTNIYIIYTIIYNIINKVLTSVVIDEPMALNPRNRQDFCPHDRRFGGFTAGFKTPELISPPYITETEEEKSNRCRPQCQHESLLITIMLRGKAAMIDSSNDYFVTFHCR